MVDHFLCDIPTTPLGLVIEGEAGIGKTTMWLAAVERARDSGYRILCARGSASESVYSYSALSDLLAVVGPETFSRLGEPQRLAIDQVMLRSDIGNRCSDQFVVASAFHAVLQELAKDSTLLVAIDDLQWVDPCSARAIEYAVRRLPIGVGVMAALRTTGPTGSISWLKLPAPQSLQRIRLGPLGRIGLRSLLLERKHSLSRIAFTRIAELSGGNPFYALELADAGDSGEIETALPTSLGELVELRLGTYGAETTLALLAVATLSSPTIAAIARAIEKTDDELVSLLTDAEDDDVIRIQGSGIRFTHPLLAHGCYVRATAGQRRDMHRRLASVVDDPELRARHLARAGTSADPGTISALDEAADAAWARGAPDTCAELLDLAIGLGADSVDRRIRSAMCRFDAGEADRAHAELARIVDELPAGSLRGSAAVQLAVCRFHGDNFAEAERILENALPDASGDPDATVLAQILLAFAWVNSGRPEDGYALADQAAELAENCTSPGLLSLALGMKVTLGFMHRRGVDEISMSRALACEDHSLHVPMCARPSFENSLLLAYVGRLHEARTSMADILRRWVKRSAVEELAVVAWNAALIELWLGNVDELVAIADNVLARGRKLDSKVSSFVAQSIYLWAAALRGETERVRQKSIKVSVLADECGAHRLMAFNVAQLGFTETSAGNYATALSVLQPLIDAFAASPCTEIDSGSWLPDAIEACVCLGMLERAESLIDALESEGARLDRPWMLSAGARGRAMACAARGDVDAAIAAANFAMTQYERLPMPFERARTQLLLGQLLRRTRQKVSSATALTESLRVFEQLRAERWAERARGELARSQCAAVDVGVLTPSEHRVAELVVSGLSNRAAAAALFISPKTVDVYLSRIYRKLDIHSRRELSDHLSAPAL